MIRCHPFRLHFWGFLALAALLFVPAGGWCDTEPRWEAIGPWGHDGQQLYPTSDPKILYATSGVSGLFRTDDQGASWREVATYAFQALTVDPRDPERLAGFAYSEVGFGILRSADGGRTFRSTNAGFSYADAAPLMSELVFDPSDSDILYAASELGLFRSVHRSRWQLIAFPGQNVHQFAIDPRSPTSWVAAVIDRGPDFSGPPIYKLQSTADAGANWNDMPGAIEPEGITLLRFDPVRPRRLYALSDWQPHWFGPAGWERLGPADLPLMSGLTISSSGQLLAVSFEGLLLSDDGGESWRRSPVPHDFLSDVASPADTPAVVLVSGSRGLWRSIDDGRTWRPSSRGISGFLVRDIVVATDGTLYESGANEGIFRSRDQGSTWKRTVRGLGSESFSNPALAVDPRHPGVVWAGAAELYQSTDGGETWQDRALPGRVAHREVNRIWVDPHREGVVIVQTYAPASPNSAEPLTYVTEDNGRTWRRFGRFYRGLGSLGFAPGARGELYADTIEGFFFSRDGGATWHRRTSLGGPSVVVIAVDPHDAATVWVGTCEDGIYRSTDGGTTFAPVAGGQFVYNNIDRIVFDPRDSQHPYVVDKGEGVFRWSGSRAGWVLAGASNPRFEARVNGTLLFDAERRVLYAGGGAGIYRLRLDQR